MPRARRLAGLLLTGAIAFGAVAGSTIGAVADDGTNAPQPSRWPVGPGASPRLEGIAHAVRLLGADRFQTNLAVTLALRGRGGFPYTTSDRTGDGDTSLAGASDWWGARSCPKAVIVVAGDNFADALAATSLSDPTDRGVGPLLERVAAADPLFDPVGGFARVDMALAPIIVTPSGRQRATSLAVSARIAAQDMAQGGCTTARSAVIVGGVGAVPRSIEPDLLSIGYTQVFRVAGIDRFDTAARVAQALGTRPVPDGTTACVDSDVTDGSARMAFYAPSVIEVREQRDLMPSSRTHRRARRRGHGGRRPRGGMVDELLAGAGAADGARRDFARRDASSPASDCDQQPRGARRPRSYLRRRPC